MSQWWKKYEMKYEINYKIKKKLQDEYWKHSKMLLLTKYSLTSVLLCSLK